MRVPRCHLVGLLLPNSVNLNYMTPIPITDDHMSLLVEMMTKLLPKVRIIHYNVKTGILSLTKDTEIDVHWFELLHDVVLLRLASEEAKIEQSTHSLQLLKMVRRVYAERLVHKVDNHPIKVVYEIFKEVTNRMPVVVAKAEAATIVNKEAEENVAL